MANMKTEKVEILWHIAVCKICKKKIRGRTSFHANSNLKHHMQTHKLGIVLKGMKEMETK